MKHNFLCSMVVCMCLLLSPLWAGCTPSSDTNKTSIVCTIYPEYDWVTNIIGEKQENFDITLLCDNGTDMHSYQPSFADIAKITTADLFIYVGGESDNWVKKALKNSTNPKMQIINLLDVLGEKAKKEEIQEGMQVEHEHSDEEQHSETEIDAEHHSEAEGETEIEYDEHVWLSLKNAKTFVSAILAALTQLDETNASIYQTKAQNYIQQLDTLDKQYSVFTSTASKNTLIFGDRFPFRYLIEDYNLKYYAAFSGCSSETEASFDTIWYLANKINELNIQVILQLETTIKQGNKMTIAETIKENTKYKDQKILTIDSMQNTTTSSNKTYLSVMASNLNIIKQALN